MAEIRHHKSQATLFQQEADAAQRQAQLARDDYGRLRAEYRRRHRDSKPEWAIDMIFKDLSVAKECVSDDNWYSRQAVEKYNAARSHWESASSRTEELVRFVQHRVEQAQARVVPEQRRYSGE